MLKSAEEEDSTTSLKKTHNKAVFFLVFLFQEKIIGRLEENKERKGEAVKGGIYNINSARNMVDSSG